MSRVVNMTVFSLALILRTSKTLCCGAPDFIIASSPHPFIILGARAIARSSNAKLFFEVRDLWPLTLIEVNKKPPYHPFITMMQQAENYAYRVSEKVISLLPRAAGYMKEHGMAANNFVYLPNGVDLDDWHSHFLPLPNEHAEKLFELKQNKQFIISYTGSHGLANALDFLVDAAALLRDRPIAFVMVGEGPEKKALQRKAKNLGLNNMTFLPPVPKTSMPLLLAATDALFIGWKKEPLYRFGISPNKLMDYMMAGKPIIHSTDAANDLVAECGCGFTVQPENAEAIAGAIYSLIFMADHERKSMGLKGREYVVENHDYRLLAKRFLDELSA